MGDVIIGVGLGTLAHLIGPWAWKDFANVLVETRLESKFFGPLIGFVAFLVPKLWCKNNKLINYLIKGLNFYFVDFRQSILNPKP